MCILFGSLADAVIVATGDGSSSGAALEAWLVSTAPLPWRGRSGSLASHLLTALAARDSCADLRPGRALPLWDSDSLRAALAMWQLLRRLCEESYSVAHLAVGTAFVPGEFSWDVARMFSCAVIGLPAALLRTISVFDDPQLAHATLEAKLSSEVPPNTIRTACTGLVPSRCHCRRSTS